MKERRWMKPITPVLYFLAAWVLITLLPLVGGLVQAAAMALYGGYGFVEILVAVVLVAFFYLWGANYLVVSVERLTAPRSLDHLRQSLFLYLAVIVVVGELVWESRDGFEWDFGTGMGSFIIVFALGVAGANAFYLRRVHLKSN